MEIKQNGNYTAYIGDRNFTIIKSKYDDGYGIMYGEKKPLWEYNGKRFNSIEDAKKECRVCGLFYCTIMKRCKNLFQKMT